MDYQKQTDENEKLAELKQKTFDACQAISDYYEAWGQLLEIKDRRDIESADRAAYESAFWNADRKFIKAWAECVGIMAAQVMSEECANALSEWKDFQEPAYKFIEKNKGRLLKAAEPYMLYR